MNEVGLSPDDVRFYFVLTNVNQVPIPTSFTYQDSFSATDNLGRQLTMAQHAGCSYNDFVDERLVLAPNQPLQFPIEAPCGWLSANVDTLNLQVTDVYIHATNVGHVTGATWDIKIAH